MIKEEDQMVEETGPVITLPEDEELVGRLRNKLVEYKERLGFSAPEAEPDHFYKLRILQELLGKGSINTWDFSKKLYEECDWLNLRAFNNACGVIESYCTDKLEEIVGGTGLPSA